jgi:hypothetical protein
MMRDRYLDVVYQRQSLIVMLYQQYADKKPVMLFDNQEQRIYALPYAEYRAELSERSEAVLKEQYELQPGTVTPRASPACAKKSR